MSEELKPCPFCGCADIDPEGWMSKGLVSAECGPSCMSCSSAADTNELWNSRPLESAAEERGRREGIEECLTALRAVSEGADMSSPETSIQRAELACISLLSERKGEE
jgi:hypothetical protein